jgi:hypothetical protein
MRANPRGFLDPFGAIHAASRSAFAQHEKNDAGYDGGQYKRQQRPSDRIAVSFRSQDRHDEAQCEPY